MPAGPTTTRRTAWSLLLALALIFVAYSRAPLGGFVWDDHALVDCERADLSLAGIVQAFRQPFFADPEGFDTRRFFRPVVTLSYAVDCAVWDGQPAGFHLTNLAFHLLCAALVFLLARRLGAGPLPAAGGAILFGTFPRLTEAVTWISGRTDLLAASCALAALLTWAARGREARHRWLAASLLLLGLFAKEVAFAGAVAIAVHTFVARRGEGRGSSRALRELAPVGLALAVYLAMRLPATGAVREARLLRWYERPPTALEALGHYGRALLTPGSPETQIGLIGFPNGPMIALGAVVAALLGLAILREVRRQRKEPNPLRAAVLALGVAAIAPTLHLVYLPMNVVAADRFLYLPLAAMAALGAAAMRGLGERARIGVAVAAAALALFFCWRVDRRNGDWLSDRNLWAGTVQVSHPNNPLPWNRYGEELLLEGDHAGALEAFRRAREAERAWSERFGIVDQQASASGLARALAGVGRYEEAADLFEEVADLPAKTRFFRLNMGIAQAQALRFEKAERTLDALVAEFPDFEEAARAAALVRGAAADWRRLQAQRGELDERTFAAREAEILARLGRGRPAVGQGP